MFNNWKRKLGVVIGVPALLGASYLGALSAGQALWRGYWNELYVQTEKRIPPQGEFVEERAMIADLGEHYRIEVPTLVVAESELPYGMIALRSHVPRSLKTFTTDQPTLLFLTSGLLKIVSREEKKAILAHEMRHAASFYTPDERDEPKPSQEPPPKPDPQADREFEEKADIASAVLVSPEAASCALTRLYRAHRTYMERRYSWWQRTLMNLTRSHDTHGTLEERIATMERFRAR